MEPQGRIASVVVGVLAIAALIVVLGVGLFVYRALADVPTVSTVIQQPPPTRIVFATPRSIPAGVLNTPTPRPPTATPIPAPPAATPPPTPTPTPTPAPTDTPAPSPTALPPTPISLPPTVAPGAGSPAPPGVGGSPAPIPGREQTATPAAPPAASDPADTVRHFYAQIGAGEYRGAWSGMSPRLRGSMNYDNWVAGFRNTASVAVPRAATIARTDDTATVTFDLVSVDTTANGPLTQTFQGTWQLVRAGDGWLLDSPSIRKTG